MAVIGSLSSVNLIAGAGILGNVGGVPLSANVDLTTDISEYASLSVVSQFASVAASGYVNQNIVANIFPALTNAIPTAYQGTLGSGTMTAAINFQANRIMGSGDIGIFEQVFNSAQALVTQTNQLINSTVNANSTSYVTGFTTQDSLITAGLSDISLAFPAFGSDLKKLGLLINFDNLNNLGSPAALLRQVADLANPTPGLVTALLNAGVPENIANDLSNAEWTDRQQKLAYEAMTQVTGSDLAQVLKLLKVSTAGINTMADLLNPIKIFPTSFDTLTAPTSSGLRGIYINDSGTINSRLETELPAGVLAPLQGNPLQNLPGTQT
jgi:hypothetical protein